MEMQRMTPKQVDQKLQAIGYQKEFVVVFIKVNGEPRKMKAMMEVPSEAPKNPDVVPVMDLEKGAWRGFRKDSVVSLEYS
jgi:hypothetical protein